jgi:hypothetical protein
MQSEHKIRTLAHQLVEIISVYTQSFAQWREDPTDLCRYERTHANLDLVRVLTDKAFPGGRGELGELLLCHSELKLLVLRRHMSRRAPAASSSRDDVDQQLHTLEARHADVVAALSAVCAQRSGLTASQASQSSRSAQIAREPATAEAVEPPPVA